MTKALVTVIDGARHEAMAAITLPTFEAYADRHGYDLLITPRVPDAPSPQWSKPTRLLEALDSHDFAVWVDCDAILAASAPDVTDHLIGTPNFQAFAWLPYSEGFVSTGVWAVRHCSLATSFLNACLGRRHLFDPADGLHDSKAIWHLLDGPNREYAVNTVLLNERWNSRRVDNDPHVYHATGARERKDADRQLNLLRAFIAADSTTPAEPSAQHVSVVFDTDDFLRLVEECAMATTEPSIDRFATVFDLLIENIPGHAPPELMARVTARLDRLALDATANHAGSRR